MTADVPRRIDVAAYRCDQHDRDGCEVFVESLTPGEGA